MLIDAVFENGVFRPIAPVNLPDHSQVELDVRLSSSPAAPSPDQGLQRVYAILGERFASGQTDGAERHDEHQP
jgi:predicted DNA-binding antitoxin AbrB/MazE fold protein